MRYFRIVLSIVFILSNSVFSMSLKEIYKTGKCRFESELVINNDSLPEDLNFKFLADIIEDKNQNILLLDSESHHLFFFNSSGKFLKIIGQKGQGPGDLFIPTCMIYNGENIHIYEYGNERFSIFNKNGEFIKIVKPKWIEKKAYIAKMKLLQNGDFVFEYQKNYKAGKKPQEMFLELFSTDLEYKKSIYSKRFCKWKYVERRAIPQPYYKKVLWDMMPNGKIAIGFTGKLEIEFHDIISTKVDVISYKYNPIKITEADKKIHFRSFMWGGKKNTPVPDIVRKNTYFPKYKPAFDKIIADCEGNILVFPDRKTSLFYAFDLDGKFINEVKILYGEISPKKIIAAKNSFFWFFEIDDGFEHYIVKYKLKK